MEERGQISAPAWSLTINVDKNNNESAHIAPFLRWAGSKKQLLPVLVKHWKASYLRYVEPFAGSASLFFHLAPQKALLADINSELIAAYNEVKNNLPLVIQALATLRDDKREYLRLRATNPATLTASFRAARFIYLNRFCFNGLYRTNRQGQFNVPYSGSKTGRVPSIEHLNICSARLRKARLLPTCFNKTLKEVQEGDFVYMDPPFAVKARRVFHEYDAASFDQGAIIKLREWLTILDAKGVAFLVSYAYSDEARFLARGFRTQKVLVKRNIAGFASKRRTDVELLIFNRVT